MSLESKLECSSLHVRSTYLRVFVSVEAMQSCLECLQQTQRRLEASQALIRNSDALLHRVAPPRHE
jgi:hypothetical protein